MKTLSLKFLCLLAVLALAVIAGAQGRTKLPELSFEKYTLPNGLTVITHVDHRLPLVAVDLWYHVVLSTSVRAVPVLHICSST